MGRSSRRPLTPLPPPSLLSNDSITLFRVDHHTTLFRSSTERPLPLCTSLTVPFHSCRPFLLPSSSIAHYRSTCTSAYRSADPRVRGVGHRQMARGLVIGGDRVTRTYAMWCTCRVHRTVYRRMVSPPHTPLTHSRTLHRDIHYHTISREGRGEVTASLPSPLTTTTTTSHRW